MDNNNINNNRLLKFQNYLKLETLLHKIEKEKFRIKSINIKSFLKKFDLIQDSQLQILQPDISIQTIPSLLSAIILIIQHYSKKYPKIDHSKKTISYTYLDESQNAIQLILRGCFQSNQIINLIENYHYQFLAIIDKLQIKNNEIIVISLNKEAFIPFRITNIQK
ncbi:unnamed protein product [Paramecium sonneborni]|nr:unnamed protein product [Paramecium sonneborni]